MLVVFQNKIIYMPGLPPSARSERIVDYAGQCGGIQWREERTKAIDGTKLVLAVTTVPLSGGGRVPAPTAKERVGGRHVYIVYFQGWLAPYASSWAHS